MNIHTVLVWYVRNVSSLFFNIRISFSIYCYYDFIFLYSRTYEEEKTVYDVSYTAKTLRLHLCEEEVCDLTFNLLYSREIGNL